jgi:hypothetical protein
MSKTLTPYWRKIFFNYYWIFVFTILLVLGFITLKSSLTVALAGDDWLILYTIWSQFDVFHSHSFLSPSSYLCTYCPPNAYMSVIKYFFGYDPFYYYLASLLFKVFAGFSIYFAVKKFTQNYLIATLASIFFVVSYIGIQSTDWVFNLYHYAGIIFGSFFLIWYWKAKETSSIKNILIATILFASSLIASPPRMHGLFPLVIIAEIGWFIIEGKKYNFKNAALRIFLLLVTYKIVFSGAGYGSTEYNLGQVKAGLKLAQDMLSKGQNAFLFNPITTVGNYVIPNTLLTLIPFEKLAFANREAFSFTTYLLPIGLFFTILGTGFLWLQKLHIKALAAFILASLSWISIIRAIWKINMITYSRENIAFMEIGGLSIIFTLFLFWQLKRLQPKLAHTLVVAMAWMITFTLFPWIIAPYTIMSSEMRYSIQQSIGLSMWMAILFYLLITNLTLLRIKAKTFLMGGVIAGIILFTTMHIIFAKDYIKILNIHRSASLDQQIWNTIFTEVPTLDKDAPSVFYLVYDDYLTAEWDLRFGFSSRAAMHYNITNQNNNPFMTLDYPAILSIATDGKALKAEGRPQIPIPLSHIYAFKLKNGHLTNITDEMRQKISSDEKALTEKSLPPPVTVQ